MVQLPGTLIFDQSPDLTPFAVTSSGRGLILNSHCPLKFMNHVDLSRSIASASPADGYGINVARGGNLFRLVSSGNSQVLAPAICSSGNGDWSASIRSPGSVS